MDLEDERVERREKDEAERAQKEPARPEVTARERRVVDEQGAESHTRARRNRRARPGDQRTGAIRRLV
jgi:hypothetical protein